MWQYSYRCSGPPSFVLHWQISYFFPAAALIAPADPPPLPASRSKTAVTDEGVARLKKVLPFYATIIREKTP